MIRYLIDMIVRIMDNSYIKWKFRKKLKFDYSSTITKNSCFEGMNKIQKNTYFSGKMGLGSYIGTDCHLEGKIGRFTSIAPYVRSNHGQHPITTPFVTTSPAFFSLAKQNGSTFVTEKKYEEFSYVDSEKKYPIIIGSDCWIGQGVFITGGVTIGDGAVVLAHAVVTKDIPPYAVVAGIPAKVVKYRYEEETIRFLLDLRWWNMDSSWLRENANLMCDMDKLKKKFNE